jgi:hypothetical protein
VKWRRRYSFNYLIYSTFTFLYFLFMAVVYYIYLIINYSWKDLMLMRLLFFVLRRYGGFLFFMVMNGGLCFDGNLWMAFIALVFMVFYSMRVLNYIFDGLMVFYLVCYWQNSYIYSSN